MVFRSSDIKSIKNFGKGMIEAKNKKIKVPNLGDHRYACHHLF